MERKTPLYDCHVALDGKMVPFAGYCLPVQYQGVIAEHMAVRQAAGLFDVSHMGEVVFSGPDALKTVNHIFSNDFTNLAVGRVRYTVMCNEGGGIVDDLILYRLAENRFMAVPNAANRAKDVAHMKAHLQGDTLLEDISDTVAQLALQGPKARAIMETLVNEQAIPEKYYSFTDGVTVAGVKCLLSRTGYTGELGYELYCAPQDAPQLWNALLDAGAPFGLVPCGLGARDTLRFEASMPLYGHEMGEDISPFEAGLDFAVKMQKEGFVGKAGLEARGEPAVARVGLLMTGRGIAREDCPVSVNGVVVGKTTSGTHCPFLGKAYAMALVAKAHTAPGTAVEVEVRGRPIAAEIVPMPFYTRQP